MFFDPFAPMKRVLSDELAACALSKISFSMHSDRSSFAWVSASSEFRQRICEAAGLSWADLLRASSTPSLCMELDAEFVQAVTNRTIYSATVPNFSDHYYVEYVDKLGRLFVNYQRILGSRLLCVFDEQQQKALFDSLVEQARAFGASEEYAKVLARSAVVADEVARRNSTQASTVKVAQSVSPVTEESSDSVLEQLSWMTPQGSSLMLPVQQMSEYAAVKRLLETAGAKYVSRKKCFTFTDGRDAFEVQALLLAGNRVNLKKDFQFFASTQPVIELMRSNLPDLEGKTVLEPSAGDGALADMARDMGAAVTTVELWDVNAKALRAKGYEPLERDFLTVTPQELGTFDVVVANPPFTGGQDIEHFMHMVQFVKPGGTLCCVMSTSWQQGRLRKQQDFRDYLATADVSIDALPAGTFKESGTGVGAVLVTLRAAKAPSPLQQDLATA